MTKYKKVGRDRSSSVLKLSIFICNAILCALGLIILGTGVFIVADRLFFTNQVFGIPIISTSAYLFIAAGSLMVIVAFIGCMGTGYGKKKLLFLHVLLLCCVFLIAIVSSALAIVFRSWVREQVRTFMTEMLQKHYGTNDTDINSFDKAVTDAWDTAQQKWYCCGVDENGWSVYRASRWYTAQLKKPDGTRLQVPESCCMKNQYGKFIDTQKCQLFDQGPPVRPSGKFNEVLFYKGCYEAGKTALYSVSLYIVIMSLIFAFVLLGDIALSIFFYRIAM